jgi:hypothetical protein
MSRGSLIYANIIDIDYGIGREGFSLIKASCFIPSYIFYKVGFAAKIPDLVFDMRYEIFVG